ncbi:MAG TPA: 50S ribosomal protein L23 [Candidatus Humimicrobiaceae bacterium]|nr:50S ribosomal protein L23 [Candidatus Humimicrobiaceae bacterium]
MGIRDIFKRKRIKPAEIKKTEATETRTQQIKPERGLEKETVKAKGRPSTITKTREVKISKAYRILKTPQVTEKSTDLAKENQYVFKVFPKTNKSEIKKAVSELYGVDVLDVKIIKVPAKKRRLGRISGWRKGYKKAIIRLKEGQKIEVLPR